MHLSNSNRGPVKIGRQWNGDEGHLGCNYCCTEGNEPRAGTEVSEVSLTHRAGNGLFAVFEVLHTLTLTCKALKHPNRVLPAFLHRVCIV